jgi:pantoate--beta-alanine ligase
MFAVNFNKITMPTEVALIDNLKSITSINSTIGFVPTMVPCTTDIFPTQQSLEENDTTVVSINPTQFNNNPEDLLKYPRTLEEDIKIAFKSKHYCLRSR